jgi:hypothetical protein
MHLLQTIEPQTILPNSGKSRAKKDTGIKNTRWFLVVRYKLRESELEDRQEENSKHDEWRFLSHWDLPQTQKTHIWGALNTPQKVWKAPRGNKK